MVPKNKRTISHVLLAVAIVIIIWLLLRKTAIIGPAGPINVGGLTIPGLTVDVGNPATYPNIDINLVEPARIAWSYGTNCLCGCDGTNAVLPGSTGGDTRWNTSQLAGAANAAVQKYLETFGYPTQVAATDRTPIDWISGQLTSNPGDLTGWGRWIH